MRRELAAVFLPLLMSVGCAWLRPRPDAAQLPAWEREATELRQLAFRDEVSVRLVTRAELPAILREDAGDLLDPAESARVRDGYAALGLLPADFDLAEESVKLMAGEAAGLYSPRSRRLFIVEPASDEEAVLFEPLVVHELVHALQHQNFPAPLQLMSELRNHDDVTAALSALVEGDASFTMLAAIAPDARSLAAAETARPLWYQAAAQPGSELALAPRFMALSMVFPYADGVVLAALHYSAGGNAGLDAALRDPPLSTLRVLHPELRAPVEFVRLPLAELPSRLAPSQCSVGTENTAGANAVGILFETDPGRAGQGPDPLAAEWRGDRFAQLACGPRWELVWFTRWSTPAAAGEFAARYRALAPAIAAKTPLSGPAEVVVDGRDALVLTPGLRAQAAWLHGAAEVRGYGSFGDWLADGCFPDPACPAAAGPAPVRAGLR